MIQHEQITFAQDAQQLLRTKTQKRKATEMRKTKESSKYRGNGSQLFFGIFAPGFATSSASFSLLQGVFSCSEFLGMEHGAIRSAPWIK